MRFNELIFDEAGQCSIYRQINMPGYRAADSCRDGQMVSTKDPPMTPILTGTEQGNKIF